MIVSFFYTYLYNPIYNLLIFFVGAVPGGDVGLAVIAVTVAVKVIILPLSLSAVRTQRAMKVIEPELKEIREKYKADKEKQAKEMFALYKKYRINPFASFLTLLIQLPILIALYWVFMGESLPTVNVEILYSFVSIPAVISTDFLGLFPITGKSIVLALLAGITQFLAAYFSVPTSKKSEKSTMSEDFGRAMAMQARYVIPFIIAIVAYQLSGAIGLFFITTNLITIAQELLVRRTPLIPKQAAAAK